MKDKTKGGAKDAELTSKNFRTTDEEVEHYSRQLQILSKYPNPNPNF
jgi:hypothetical protein